MKDNTMKKWQPYKSLIEQEIELKKMRFNRDRIEKPILFDDKLEELNYKLQNYNGEMITIQYFNDGYLYNKTCKIKRIDPIYRSILLDDNSKLSLEDIVDIID